MHVLLIHEIFVTPDEGGGTRHYELAKYLVKKGYKFTVIASDIDYLSGKRKKKRREKREGIEIIYSKTLFSVHKNFIYRALAFFSFSISAFINGLRVENIDIVIGTSPPLFQALAALLIAKIKRKIFIYEVRDLWLDFAVELNIIKNKYIINLLRKLENILYRKADKIVINSPGFIPTLSTRISIDKIALIPNGVISKDFEVDEKESLKFRRELGLEDKFVVMYTGNVGVANDIYSIVNSAEKLRNYKDIVFVIIGEGIKKQEIINYVKEKNLSNVIFLEPYPKKDIPKVLSSADVCLATLKNTPLLNMVYPNKVFDYMASGKPTILAIDGVIKEVIDKANGGTYVSPGDSSGIVEAVLKYYKNRELCKIHGQNAKNYVKSFFEREKIAEDLERLLFELYEKSRN